MKKTNDIANELHTPSPWQIQGPKIQEDFGGQVYYTIMPDPYKSKADPYKAVGFFYPYSGVPSEQQAANAKLICEAVNNYQSLKESNEALIENLENCIERMERARGILKRNTDANWGMLDTTHEKDALNKAKKQ
jgi:hypothetical protein